MVKFTRRSIGELINLKARVAMNLLCLTGDINNDGLVDIVISGRNGKLVWFENKGENTEWEMHLIDEIENLEAGGVLYDLTGNGYPDLIIGSDYKGSEVFWWENPGAKGGKWTKRLLARGEKTQFHDQIIGDIKGNGRNSLVFWNQLDDKLYCVDIPGDPTVSPWPDLEVIVSGLREEGLAIGDIDGDGKNELVSGNRWYKYNNGTWEVNQFSEGYVSTRVQLADIDGDGKLEIILAEGDAHMFGKPQGGKLSWFKAGRNVRDLWEEHVVEDFLQDPHSMQVGNFCGNGLSDIFVGEIGNFSDNTVKPRLLVFENDGKGNFTRHLIDEGVGTHEAKAADLRNKGVLDIVGKPLLYPEKWNIHVWYNNAGGEVY